MGSFVIDLTPGFLKETVIRAFGTGDKPFLIVVLVVLLLVLGAVAGLLELRRAPLGRVLIVVIGLVAAGAAATRHGASVVDVAPSLVDLVVGVLVLAALVGRLRPRPAGEARALPTESRARRPQRPPPPGCSPAGARPRRPPAAAGWRARSRACACRSP